MKQCDEHDEYGKHDEYDKYDEHDEHYQLIKYSLHIISKHFQFSITRLFMSSIILQNVTTQSKQSFLQRILLTQDQ